MSNDFKVIIPLQDYNFWVDEDGEEFSNLNEVVQILQIRCNNELYNNGNNLELHVDFFQDNFLARELYKNYLIEDLQLIEDALSPYKKYFTI